MTANIGQYSYSQEVSKIVVDSNEEKKDAINSLVNENSISFIENTKKKLKLKPKSKQLLDFKDIAPIIWNMQCELRNKEGITGINAMHHINLILLIRTLNKPNCNKLGIPQDFTFENIKDLNQKDLFERIYSISNPSNCLLRYIRHNEKFGFNKDIPFEIKNESTLHYLVVKVLEIDTKYFFEKTDLIGDIYESFINREGKTMKDLGQYFTDRQLIDYLVKLCDPKVIDGKIETIYDGASGTGGFLTQAINYLNTKSKKINWEINKHNIYGSDINRNTFALLKLNMYFTTGQIIDNLVMKDTLVHDSLKVDGFDNILMNPPFGIKGLKYTDMNSKIKAIGINGTKGEILFLHNCMANLAQGGRCVIIVPDGVLFNSTKMYKETRKYLMDNFELKKVIKVGEGEFFKNTGVKTAVLFFENTGESTKMVKFLQVNKVGNEIDEVPLMDVSIEKIVENSYSLNMNMYKEVVVNNNTSLKNMKLRELFDINYGGNLDTIETDVLYPSIGGGSKISKYTNKYNLNENTIIVSRSGSCGQVNIIKTKSFLGSYGYSLIPKVNNINIKYVYYYLKSKEPELEQLSSGATVNNINRDILYDYILTIPSSEIQQRIVEQLDNIYENEIENSKKSIEGLEKSIENIMKNTLMRKDLGDYKISDITNKISCGCGVDNSERNGSLYPYYGSNGVIDMVDKFNFDGENILVARKGSINSIHMSLGKCQIYDGTFVFNSKDIKLFKNKYLYLYMVHNIDFNDYANGITIKSIPSIIFKNIKLKLPPLEIQEKIVRECNSKETIINLLKDNIIQAEKQGNEIMNILFK